MGVGITSGDFNGDGNLDIAFTEPLNVGDLRLDVCLGEGSGAFQPCVGVVTGPDPKGVIAADFNGDGTLDLATADNYQGSGFPSVSVVLGNGDGTFQEHRDFATAQGPFALAAGDFNGDGRLDLAVADFSQNTGSQISILLGKGDGTFQYHVDYQTASGPDSVVVGDFNRDGKLDVITADYGPASIGNISVLLGNGDGTFQNSANYAVGGGPSSVAVGDFNADGRLDVAVVNSLDSTVSVLIGNGDGTFQTAVSYVVGLGATAVDTADFNSDGRLDLVVTGGTVWQLLGNGDGTFQAAISSPAGNAPSLLTVGDFDGDGRLDLCVIDHAFSASVLLQTSGQR